MYKATYRVVDERQTVERTLRLETCTPEQVRAWAMAYEAVLSVELSTELRIEAIHVLEDITSDIL